MLFHDGKTTRAEPHAQFYSDRGNASAPGAPPADVSWLKSRPHWCRSQSRQKVAVDFLSPVLDESLALL